MQLRLFQSQRHVRRERVQERFVLAAEPFLLVQQLQNTDDGARFIPDGQAEELVRFETQLAIDIRLEAWILVGVFQPYRRSFAGHPARYAAIRRQPDYLLFETQADKRPDFVALAVHEKDGSAFRAGLARGNLQNDVDEFAQIERGVQLLGGFDDARQFLHRAAAFRQREHHRGKSRQ